MPLFAVSEYLFKGIAVRVRAEMEFGSGGGRGISTLIVKLGSRWWRRVVNITYRPF